MAARQHARRPPVLPSRVLPACRRSPTTKERPAGARRQRSRTSGCSLPSRASCRGGGGRGGWAWMEPLGFVFGGYPPPLRRGHLPLADLTVLLGPNDAGKSRTLGALAATLDGRSPPRGAAVIAECGPDERALLSARLGSSALADDGAPLVIVEPADGGWQLSSASFERCYGTGDLGAEGLP